MCSSQKHSPKVKELPLNIDEELTDEQRLRFAAKANIAQARSDAALKNSSAQQAVTLRCFNLVRWLKKYFLSS